MTNIICSVLKKAGIKQLVDLPGVGMNLNDQPGTDVSATVLSAVASNTSLIDGRNLFAPDISLVNIDEIFTTSAYPSLHLILEQFLIFP